MAIPVSGAYETELERESGFVGVFLLDLNFTTGHRRFALCEHNVSYDSDTYEGLGPVQQVDALEQDEGGAFAEMALAFMVANDPDLLEDLQQNSRRRFADCYLVFLNPTTRAVVNDEAMYLWRKRMVPGPGISASGVYVSSVQLEDLLHQNRNKATPTYSHAQQLRRDATDFCLFDAGKNLDVTREDYKQRSGLS